MSVVVDSTVDKMYGLHMASMTQRSMLTLLFDDYCDTLFYHAFRPCSQEDVPLLGEDMTVLLDKVLNIEWNTIIDKFLPGMHVLHIVWDFLLWKYRQAKMKLQPKFCN